MKVARPVRRGEQWKRTRLSEQRALLLPDNRRRDRVKLLFWDGDGYALFYKRLARGTFEFPVPQDPRPAAIEIRGSELSMLLDGIELEGRRRRLRYERPAVPA